MDTYEVAWRSVIDAGAAAVMCAYSSLCHDDKNETCALPPPAGYGISHGIPMCADAEMLNGWMRNASVRAGPGGISTPWDGMVTGDCGAIQFIETDHLWAADQTHAAADAILAGADFDCSISIGKGFAALLNATAMGLVAVSDIDRALGRLISILMRQGLFDPPSMVPYTTLGMDRVNSAEHRGLAATAAREGIVLLANSRQLLPLSVDMYTPPGAVLVTGPNAQLYATGNYNTQNDHNVVRTEVCCQQRCTVTMCCPTSMYRPLLKVSAFSSQQQRMHQVCRMFRLMIRAGLPRL